MRFIHATYNMLYNCIDVTTFDGYVLRIDCEKAEEGLNTTPCSECALNALPLQISGRFIRTVVKFFIQRS